MIFLAGAPQPGQIGCGSPPILCVTPGRPGAIGPGGPISRWSPVVAPPADAQALSAFLISNSTFLRMSLAVKRPMGPLE